MKTTPPFRQCGSDVTIYSFARLLSPENTIVGSHVIIDDFVFIGSHRRLILGNHVHIASHASITGGGEVLLADFCGVSSGARLLSGTDDFTSGALTGPTLPAEFRNVERGRIFLGSHVVIGSNAVVLPGVTIGEGSVVGAGSIVNRDLEPWGVYVGAPVRRVRERPKDVLLENERRFF